MKPLVSNFVQKRAVMKKLEKVVDGAECNSVASKVAQTTPEAFVV